MPSAVAERALQRDHRVRLDPRPRRTAAGPASRAAAAGTLAPASPSTATSLGEVGGSPAVGQRRRAAARMLASAPVGIGPDVGRSRLARGRAPGRRASQTAARQPVPPPSIPRTKSAIAPPTDNTKTIPKARVIAASSASAAQVDFRWTIGIALASSIATRGNRIWRRSATETRHDSAPRACSPCRRRGAGAPPRRPARRRGRRSPRAIPAIEAAAAAIAAEAIASRPPPRLCRRRQLGPDGARRRAGARRHLRHPARPHAGADRRRRRDAARTLAGRRRGRAATAPRRRRRARPRRRATA